MAKVDIDIFVQVKTDLKKFNKTSMLSCRPILAWVIFAYGSVKGRDHIMNAIAHYGNTYFFSVDLRDFFTNISNGAVYRTFRCYNFSPTISRKLTQLTTFKHELPQGPPSSPFIANMVFDPTGNKLFKKAQANQIIFTSYLDDLAFSSRVDFTVFLPEILKDLTDDGFVLNQKKISYRKTKAEITGIPVSSKGITVPNVVRERAKKNARVRQYSIRIENISNMLFH